MKIIFYILAIMTLITPTLAQDKIFIDTDTYFDDSNITLNNSQYFDNSIDMFQNGTLRLPLNGSSMDFYTVSYKTIANYTYNYTSDKLEFNATGTADPLNMTIMMRRFNVSYNESIDSLVVAENKSDANKIVIFNFSDWTVNKHNVIIEINGSSINFFILSGYVSNKINESIPLANVTLINKAYDITDINGFYQISAIEPGNYTLKAIKFPYANKTILVSILNDTTLNFTMSAQSGGTQFQDDFTPVYIFGFLILLMIGNSLRNNKGDEGNE